MSKMPAKKNISNQRDSSSTKKVLSQPVKSTKQLNETKATNEKEEKKTEEVVTTAVDQSKAETVKYVRMKQVIPKEMEKLENLTKWPIIMDEIGNLKTFYRVNEIVIDFNIPLTVQRIQMALQRTFFGLSFNSDGSIDDHRKYTIPNDVNRLISIIMEDNDIGKCVEELRKNCAQLHPDLFDTVFGKANVKDSGRDDLDRLFIMTRTPDEIRQADYYQFGAKCRSEIPLTCVWITDLIDIPPAYDNLFGPRFKLIYN